MSKPDTHYLKLADTFTCPWCERVLKGFSGKDIGITTEIADGVTKAVVICKECFKSTKRMLV